MVPSFRDMQQHRGRRRNGVGAAWCSDASQASVPGARSGTPIDLVSPRGRTLRAVVVTLILAPS